MRVAISGMGLRSGHVLSHFKTQMPEVEFVGFYDPQPSHLDMLGGDIPQFDDIAEMLARTGPDLFFVGSPNQFHLEQIAIGLTAGVRIFAEKPVVCTIDETMELAKLLAEHGPDRVMVGLVLRYSHHMVDLRASIAAGHLGPIASMEGSEHIGPYHGAFFMRDWRRKSSRSGGFMLEKCCHDLDIYNMIAASRPHRVASFGGRRSFLPVHAPADNSSHEVYHIKKSVWDSADDPFRSDADIIDCQTAILEYETGASLAFHTNINVPDEHRHFCVVGAYGMAEGDFHRGYLRVTDARRNERVVDKDYTSLGQGRGHYGADEMMVADIVAHLNGTLPDLPVSVIDALEAGIAAMAVDEARASGQIVHLDETWKRFDDFGLRKQ